MRCLALALVACLALAGPAAAQNLPALPQVFLDTTYDPPTGGQTITVNTGDDLQAAFNQANPGDVIVVQAGATFTGNFVLPFKPGDGWIYVRTSAYAMLPPPGTRVNPTHASMMPKMVSPNTIPALTTELGAHHWRLVGIEIATTHAVRTSTHGNIILLGFDPDGNPATTPAEFPTDITFDRCYIHGTPTGNIVRGVTPNSARTAVIDSYISDIHSTSQDSQAIGLWAGPGPFKFVNNYLEGSGENIIFGGASPTIENLVPSDAEIRHNHFFKPLSWRVGDPTFAGIAWVVKNLFELKNAQRILIDGNIFENCWPAAQAGIAIQLTVRNDDGTAPWSVVQDVTFTRNIIRHVAGGVNFLGIDTNAIAQQEMRILIRDNVFTDLTTTLDPRLFQILNNPADVTIEHNTAFQVGPTIIADLDPATRFVFRNNIAPEKQGVIGSGTGRGLPTLNFYFPGFVYAGNVQPGGPDPAASYPAGNFFPASLAAVGFVDLAGGDFRLDATSPFKGQGTDGKDPGADIDAVETATAGVVEGLDLPVIVSITAPAGGAIVNGTVNVTASATAPAGVAGVQFKLNGANLGAEVTAPPFTVMWNTMTVANGPYTLTAVGRDTLGNMTTSPAVSVTVQNVFVQAALTVTVKGSGQGTVVSSPAGISCPTDCQESFALNTAVTLTPMAAPGSTFAGFTGDADCSDGQVTMSGTRKCTATFTGIADLTVAAVAAPATGFGGQPLVVTSTVTNTGVVGAGAFRMRFSMSPADSTPGAGTVVGFRDIASLGVGLSSTATTTVTVPAGFAPGLYFFSAVADSAGVVPETSETNNGRTAADRVSVTAFGPELVVAALTAPAAGVVGKPLALASTVRNQGPAAAGKFRVTFFLSPSATPGSGTMLGVRDVTSLASGAVSAAGSSFMIAANTSPGTYFVSAVADTGGAVSELDEASNGRTTGMLTVTLFQPDLMVSALTSPATAAAGKPLTVANTIKNQGPAPATAFRVTFYLSASATPGTGTVIGFRDIASLAAGATSAASTVLTIPANASAGAAFVSAVADGNAVITELSETNNGLAAPITVTAFQPDLVLTALTAPASGAAGKPITIASTVKNQGPAPAGAFRITFFLSDSATPGSGTPLGFRIVTSLAAGAQSTASSTFTLAANTSPGVYVITAVADSAAAVTELDETNNGRSAAIMTTVTLFQPDLTVTVLTPPAIGAIGKPITVANAIKNVGPAPAGKFRVTFFLSDSATPGTGTVIGFRDVASLAANATSAAATALTIPANASAGAAFVSAVADSAAAITELSEANNGLGAPITIVPFQADLAVTALTPPPTGALGKPITVVNAVKNVGPAPAGKFRVTFFLSDSATPGTGTVIGFRDVASLAANATSAAATALTIPANASAGAAFVSAVADSAAVITELSEANNGLAAPITLTLFQPDLTVPTLTAPATAPVGKAITVASTIKNQGPAPAAKFRVTFFLSTSATPGTGTVIGFRDVASLAAGAAAPASTRLTIPANASVGASFVSAVADSNVTITELNEGNNGAAAPIALTPFQPDLAVTALTSPASGALGKTIIVASSAKNLGPASAATFRVTFFLSTSATPGSGTVIGFRDVASLAAGATSTASTNLAIPANASVGASFISAVADSNGVITELGEANNGLAASITLTLFQPDLTLTALTAPATVVPGAKVSVTSAVKNQGPAPASGFRITFSVSTTATPGTGTVVGSRDLTGLAGGATSAASTVVTLPPTLAPGAYFVTAVADSGGVVTEMDETNNGRSTGTTIP